MTLAGVRPLWREHLVEPLARADPRRALLLPRRPGYWDSVGETAHGEWVLDPAWRPRESFPVRPGWMKAVLAGHAAVAQRLAISSPVLGCCPDAPGSRPNGPRN